MARQGEVIVDAKVGEKISVLTRVQRKLTVTNSGPPPITIIGSGGKKVEKPRKNGADKGTRAAGCSDVAARENPSPM